MRIFMLGAAAIALSGCSFLGLGGQKDYSNYNKQTGYYGQKSVQNTAPTTKCHTGNCLARWNLEGGLGTSLPVSKNIITASRVNPNPNRDFNSVSFGDAFDTGIRAELGGSYALAPNTKVTLLGHYEHADGSGVQDFGTITGDTLTARLSDYEAFGGEIGLRQYFRPRKAIIVNSIRPYVEARAGASRVNDIVLKDTELGGTRIGAREIGLYEDSWVGTAAGLVGVETPVARYTTIGLETGLRYQSGLKSDTSVLSAGRALGGLNNNRGRVTVPITLRGRYRF